MNRVTLLGRLGQDPETRSFQNGDKLANFSVATTQSWKDKQTGERREKTEWHSVVVTGPLVRIVEQYLKKGARVLIEGSLRTRKYQDQSGVDRYKTEIAVTGHGSSLDIIDWPNSDGGTSHTHQSGHDAGPPDLDSDIPF